MKKAKALKTCTSPTVSIPLSKMNLNEMDPLMIADHSSDHSGSSYRISRRTPSKIEKIRIGEVSLRHNYTSICPSDIYYYKHDKDEKKLDERLPIEPGHETTATIEYINGKHEYINLPGQYIKKGDKVVVIPQQTCGTCEICKDGYGENYSMCSRFMGSNASGSMRTKYFYNTDLVIKIPDSLEEVNALMTEPLSNITQAVKELGFVESKKNFYKMNLTFRESRSFDYLHLTGTKFTDFFNLIMANEPYPRTTFFFDPKGLSKTKPYKLLTYPIMRKGLGLFGAKKTKSTTIGGKAPKILIIGSGTIGYLFALVFSCVYGIPKDQLFVIGRSREKLNYFDKYAKTYSTLNFNNGGLTKHLQSIGQFDIALECVGGEAMAANIEMGLSCLKKRGSLGLIGLSKGNIPVNIAKLMEKEIFLKGFFRGDRESYCSALRLISNNKKIQEGISPLLGEIHKVSTSLDLENVFNLASKGSGFGRQIVELID